MDNENQLSMNIKNFEDGIYGELQANEIFVKFYSTGLDLTNLKEFYPTGNRKVKRFMQYRIYNYDIAAENFNKYKKLVLAKVHELNITQLIKELKELAETNNEKIELVETEIKKNKLPSLTKELSNKYVKIEYDDNNLSAEDLTDSNNIPKLYLDVPETQKRALIRLFNEEFEFDKETLFGDLKRFLVEKSGGKYPFHEYCGMD